MSSRVVCTLLVTYFFCLFLVNTHGRVVFRTEPISPLVYQDAGSGEFVCSVKAYDNVTGDSLVQYKLALLTDTVYFVISEDTGVISTSGVQIGKAIGEVYELRVYGVLAGKTYDMAVSVTVATKNIFSPVFDQTVYTFHVHNGAQPPSSVGTVRATDEDPDSFNKNLEYSSSDSGPFWIEKSTGDILLNVPLPATFQGLDFEVYVTDQGVPPLSSSVIVSVLLTSLPAPDDFCNSMAGENGKVCWKVPDITNSYTGFRFAYGSESVGVFYDFIVNSNTIVGDEACVSPPDVIAGERYLFYIWTTNGTTESQRSRKGSFTPKDKGDFLLVGPNCSAFNVCNLVEPCAHGGQCLWRGQLKFSCECTDGWQGEKCQEPDPCSPNPCVNSGGCIGLPADQYQCDCGQEFYGTLCQNRDLCLDKPCQNGGACVRTIDGGYFCNCTETYIGTNCEQFDPCQIKPCDRGTCFTNTTSINGFSCACKEGYSGSLCSIANQCITKPGYCKNGGTCQDLGNGYAVCFCSNEFTGQRCESFNACSLDICQNNSTCLFRPNNQYRCSCYGGYYGQECQHYNRCTDLPCVNGGTCTNTTSSFSCECGNGFSGKTCEIYDPCHDEPCERGGICNVISGVDFNCTCSPERFGKTCAYVNSCQLQFCKNGATCENTTLSGDFVCHCAEGFYGQFCTKYNPCVSSPCSNNGDCVNITSVEFNCTCREGYAGALCDTKIPDPPCFGEPCLNGGQCEESGVDFTCNCSLGYQGKTCEEQEGCPSELTEDGTGSYAWPSSGYAILAHLRCPIGPEGKFAARRCGALAGFVKWGTPDTSNCTSKDEGFATQQLEELKSLTSDPSKMGPDDVANVTGKLEFVFEFSLRNEKIANALTEVVSNVMDVKEEVLRISQARNHSSQRMVEMIGNFTSQADVSTGQNVTLVTENINVIALERGAGDSELIFSPSFLNNNAMVEPNATIVLPSDLLRDNTSKSQRIEFAAFKSAKFFLDDSTNETTDTIVISASILGRKITNLTDPIIIKLPMNQVNRNYTCKFWNETDNTWSTDGVVTAFTDSNFTECHTYHLTSFAILMDPSPGYKVPEIHDTIQTYITYIGCGISMLGLTITIITFGMFRCLHGDKSGKILLNLCVSMLLLNIVFVLGSQKGSQYGKEICMTVAVLIHYFLLTSLMWMCMEAGNMYRVLVTVFTKYTSYFMLKRCIAAWGLPAVVVSITLAVSLSNYETKDEFCFISHANVTAFYVAVLAPACVIILINTVVFIMVSRVIMKPRFTGHINGGDSTLTAAQVRGAFAVMFLLGVAWVFGPLAINEAKIVFSYIFCIANAFQGFFIFIFRCFINPEARAAWLQLIKTGTFKRRRGPTAPTTTSSASKGDSKVNGVFDYSKRNTMVLNENIWNTDKYIQRSGDDVYVYERDKLNNHKDVNCYSNGHNNGNSNVHTNGHSNVHTNGHRNVHTNGHSNGIHGNESVKSRQKQKGFSQI